MPVTRSQTSKTSTTNLLQLPAELRLQIFRLVLVEDETIKVDARRAQQCWHKHKPVPNLFVMTSQGRHMAAKLREHALLSTCRQIRSEGLPVLYGDNIFESTDFYALYRWLKSLESNRRRLLRTIRYWNHSTGGYSDSVSTAGEAKVQIAAAEAMAASDKAAVRTGVFEYPLFRNGERVWVNGPQVERILKAERAMKRKPKAKT